MSNEAGGKSYGKGVTPWELCESMESSGFAHVDTLRCDVVEYAFRSKGDKLKMIDDLEKAAHCAKKAADFLRSSIPPPLVVQSEKRTEPLDFMAWKNVSNVCTCHACYDVYVRSYKVS